MSSLPADLEILVVEDDPGHARLMEILLRDQALGSRLVKIARGDAALTYLGLDQDEKPVRQARMLILLDINLPGASGFDVLKALRARETERRTLVVMVSSSDDPADHRRATELDADGYLAKPPTIDELAATFVRLGLTTP